MKQLDNPFFVKLCIRHHQPINDQWLHPAILRTKSMAQVTTVAHHGSPNMNFIEFPFYTSDYLKMITMKEKIWKTHIP